MGAESTVTLSIMYVCMYASVSLILAATAVAIPYLAFVSANQIPAVLCGHEYSLSYIMKATSSSLKDIFYTYSIDSH